MGSNDGSRLDINIAVKRKSDISVNQDLNAVKSQTSIKGNQK